MSSSGTTTLGGAPRAPRSSPESLADRLHRACVKAQLFEPERAPLLGRFRVRRKLGEGGTGSVFEAVDPALDRVVAIKLLHPSEEGRALERERLRDEAQAMARLSHPNVVQVYEVDEREGQLYLVMELVAGETLRARQRALREARERGWERAVMDMYVEAGHGLAAAHRAGVVHGDFKPENVLVDRERRARVRVCDFGLARLSALDAEAHETVRGVAGSELTSATAGAGIASSVFTAPDVLATTLRVPLTRVAARGGRPADAARPTLTASICGTPAYMAPEQFEGHRADARCDQFSFCVALWEALTGARPFAGATLPELVGNVRRGQLPPATRGAALTGWLRRVLTRGLAVDPAARWPTLDALLEAIAADPGRRRRRVAAVVMLGLVTSGGFTWESINEANARAEEEAARVARRQACVEEAAAIDQVWGDERRAEVERAFAATGLDEAAAAWGRARVVLDDYAAGWRALSERICVESHVTETRATEPAALAAACLEGRRAALDALAESLAESDAAGVRRAVYAAATLPRLERCDSPRALERTLPRPAEEDARDRVKAVRVQLERVNALNALSRHEEALARARRVTVEAEATGWEPLQAEVALALGAALDGLGRADEARVELERAYFLAGDHAADELVVRAAARLTFVVGMEKEEHRAGLGWGRQGQMFLARAGDEDSLDAAELMSNLAAVHLARDEFDEALALDQRALEIRTAVLGEQHVERAESLLNIAVVRQSREEYDEAEALLRRVLAIYERAYGPEHPEVALVHTNLGVIALARARYDDARRHLERSRSIREAWFGADSLFCADNLVNLGIIELRQEQPERALTTLRRATAIYEAAHGPEHPDIARTTHNIGMALSSLGRDDEALAAYERALAIREATLGPEHAELASSLHNIAGEYFDRGDIDKTLELERRAFAISERTYGPDSRRLAYYLTMIGRAHHARGELEQARASLERAMALREREPGPGNLAATRWYLIKVLWDARARAEARALARVLREELVARGPSDELRSLDTWLKEHPVR